MIDPKPSPNTNPTGNQPDITVLPGGLSLRIPGPQLGTHITREDFFVLMEGAGTPKEASVRDASLGVGFTSITTALSIFLSCDLFRQLPTSNGPVSVPVWGPMFTSIILGLVGVFALLLAYVANSRAKRDTGRRSYSALIDRLRFDLNIDTEAKKPNANIPRA